MMTFADKYDMLFDDSNCDYCEPLQDKLDRGDFHCWVEDAQGKFVFDANEQEEFFELECVKDVRDCIGDTIRVPFLDQTTSVRYAIQGAIAKQRQSEDYGIAWKDRWFNQEHEGKQIYQWRMCNVNCLNFLKENKGKGYKMVVGATGWRTGCGEAWFEWG